MASWRIPSVVGFWHSSSVNDRGGRNIPPLYILACTTEPEPTDQGDYDPAKWIALPDDSDLSYIGTRPIEKNREHIDGAQPVSIADTQPVSTTTDLPFGPAKSTLGFILILVHKRPNGRQHRTGHNAQVEFLMHVVAYVANRGHDVPTGMHISHLCDNRKCFNPSHLVGENHYLCQSRFRGGICGDSMGLGKTLLTLHMARKEIGCFSLVVCPASCKLQWVNQISEAYREGYEPRVLVLEDPRTPASALVGKWDIIIVSYNFWSGLYLAVEQYTRNFRRFTEGDGPAPVHPASPFLIWSERT
ncbi:hypothetical protein Asppvi_011320 [Aspergillus pseudoviridinutans]|uniref:Zinc-binding loop region of homing endonuclease domain-containing protein n=1 Tax=Aspergillus pseudoviridinutans TaxID=1517512 RepID=A0A9P3BQY1_9EURO|nr:uncharacterized protein Asppvi_011320 [Aspergillus pseudoviridinutans]GIJ92339.1 hypothetical protein Asppvi_011320 [Aspergillus pseudoviridinutans]